MSQHSALDAFASSYAPVPLYHAAPAPHHQPCPPPMTYNTYTHRRLQPRYGEVSVGPTTMNNAAIGGSNGIRRFNPDAVPFTPQGMRFGQQTQSQQRPAIAQHVPGYSNYAAYLNSTEPVSAVFRSTPAQPLSYDSYANAAAAATTAPYSNGQSYQQNGFSQAPTNTYQQSANGYVGAAQNGYVQNGSSFQQAPTGTNYQTTGTTPYQNGNSYSAQANNTYANSGAYAQNGYHHHQQQSANSYQQQQQQQQNGYPQTQHNSGYAQNGTYQSNGFSQRHTYNNSYANSPSNQMAQTQQPPESFCQFQLSDELSDKLTRCRNQKCVLEVQIGLEQMVGDPHDFETWAVALRPRFLNLCSGDLDLVASLLLEMAYLCPDCQYNFSRLCKTLDKDIQNFTTNMVIPKIAQLVATQLSELDAEQICHLSLFLGELYDKTEVNGVRVARLGQYLLDLIRVLLDIDPLTDKIVKCVVQVLKLTGRYIEDDQDPVYLNEVFEKLAFIQQNSRTISESAKHNIRQLHNLRERQWGVTHGGSDDPINGYPSSEAPPSSEVMYGPDGVPLTEEECAFLEENCRYDVDDDMAAEYERFLRDQTEQTAVSTAEKALEKLAVED